MRAPFLHLLTYLALTAHASTVIKNATVSVAFEISPHASFVVSSRPTRWRNLFTDNLLQYDDILILSGETPLGTYDNLVYNLVNVTRARPSYGLAGNGVITASSPNCALTAARQLSTTSGTTSFTVTSPYKSLELLDFYYGCVTHAAQESLAADAPAVQCTITVTGFLRDTYEQAAMASYEFSPPEGLLLPVGMNHAILPVSFQRPLFNFTLTQSNPYAVVLLDNLHYSVST